TGEIGARQVRTSQVAALEANARQIATRTVRALADQEGGARVGRVQRRGSGRRRLGRAPGRALEGNELDSCRTLEGGDHDGVGARVDVGLARFVVVTTLHHRLAAVCALLAMLLDGEPDDRRLAFHQGQVAAFPAVAAETGAEGDGDVVGIAAHRLL